MTNTSWFATHQYDSTIGGGSVDPAVLVLVAVIIIIAVIYKGWIE